MATVENLWGKLAASRTRTISGQHFISQLKLKAIFTVDSLAKCIEELQIDDAYRIGLKEYVVNDATTLFAILVWMQKPNAVVEFREHAIKDRNLPLDVERARKIDSNFGKTFAEEIQWEFLPYKFRKTMCDSHVQIHDTVILPFIEEVSLTSGGSGDITKVRILASQQEFFTDTVSTSTTSHNLFWLMQSLVLGM